jgi:hypothetical protein
MMIAGLQLRANSSSLDRGHPEWRGWFISTRFATRLGGVSAGKECE